MDYSAVYLQQMASAQVNNQKASRKPDTRGDDGEFARLMKKNSGKQNEPGRTEAKPVTDSKEKPDAEVPLVPEESPKDQALYQAAGLLLAQFAGQMVAPEDNMALLQTQQPVEGAAEIQPMLLVENVQPEDENSRLAGQDLTAGKENREPDSYLFRLEKPAAENQTEPLKAQKAPVPAEPETVRQPVGEQKEISPDIPKTAQEPETAILQEALSSQASEPGGKTLKESVQDKKDKAGQTEALQAASGQNHAELLKDVKGHKISTGDQMVFASKQTEQPVAVENLKDHLIEAMNSGKKELEIQLEPENLGKLAVKISQDGGHTTVSIVCSESRTHQMLSQHAREMGAIMEDNLGKPTQVVVEQHGSDYLEQQNRQDGQDRGDREENGKHKKQNQNQYSVDFVQKLRMGLASEGEIQALNW